MMKQREITDQSNTAWTCVQAYAGLDSETAEQATKLAEAEDGTVTVVCTPSGGAQTVRLELDKGWLDDLSDEELTSAISSAGTGN
ncbi:hypothetical protein [Hymenobacter radiodurans]|uniref:hypothetical protein n=1 Tax=Hymenobacter radiodurans TaxID=2496028 RepID=UPI001F100F75|nr:hypothetical protein [Hymenobacter radiodurans]